MKKQILLLFGLLLFNLIFAQEPAIKITHGKSQREVVIEENQRIKVETEDGRKLKGPFRVKGDSTISIKGELISLADIAELKRVNVWIPVLLGGALIMAGGIMIAVGIVSGVFLSATYFLWVIPGSLRIGAGAVLPSLLGIYKNDGKCAFEIVMSST
ncbi:hypothetical protein O3Q51_08675 [Cryomorphaceae bacterium 1068]|nr:hypothetical protein [Cryomorphaceae bacterium 1068]